MRPDHTARRDAHQRRVTHQRGRRDARRRQDALDAAAPLLARMSQLGALPDEITIYPDGVPILEPDDPAE
jgi:hypothetical protein